MPTPAKLVAAILMAAVAWFTAEAVVRYALPEGSSVGRFREICAVIGLFFGWRMLGRAATGVRGRGDKIVNSLTMGMATSLAILVLAVFLHGFYQMISESMKLAYDQPGKAATAMIGFIKEDFILVANPIIIGVLLGGGAVAGLMAGVTGRVWR
ncbi:TrgA family protein [Jannaschia aquimarina]|uniref:Uncharacterized protein n=1 Tax=Jannaschia aquimarina TaxID=935700 RepID=A0A0D1EJJ1_9RHOB|nr:TrgA family protein [Jannaschia aquimarina]KIT15965.1 hypothetical protein jaqu_22340 [Jannaschia aquimarina]SNS98850.1 hypothetical protein SAMN05421775_104145 [Jannaschia aquimarina]